MRPFRWAAPDTPRRRSGVQPYFEVFAEKHRNLSHNVPRARQRCTWPVHPTALDQRHTGRGPPVRVQSETTKKGTGDPYVPLHARLPPVALAALAALPMALLQATPALAQAAKSVEVLSIVEHPALDAIRDGVKEELKAQGFDAGKSLKWEYQSAQGSAATAAQIARKFIGDKPDAIVAITTPAAQAVVAATKTVRWCMPA